MLETVEITYRCVCDVCGVEQILTMGKGKISDPIKHFQSVGWVIDGGRAWCGCRIQEDHGMKSEKS